MPIEDSEFTDLFTQVKLINQKLDLLIASQKEQYVDHETRIRKLEQVYWKVIGASLVISIIATYIMGTLK